MNAAFAPCRGNTSENEISHLSQSSQNLHLHISFCCTWAFLYTAGLCISVKGSISRFFVLFSWLRPQFVSRFLPWDVSITRLSVELRGVVSFGIWFIILVSLLFARSVLRYCVFYLP